MTNLYDVFQAIRADEGDHVSAMKACLDPSVALISPSIERRVLSAAVLIATVGFFASGNGVPSDAGLDESTAEGFIGGDILDAAVAGVAGIVGQILDGSPADSVDGAESAVEGVEMMAEGVNVEKAISAAVGGLAGILGISNIARNRKPDVLGGNQTDTSTTRDETEQ